jgi:diguanylate cyclase (GGDEF)-like protein/PAS domain S-box-containing protein
VQTLYRQIVEEGPSAIVAVGPDGRVSLASSEAVRLLGADPTGRRFGDLFDGQHRHGARSYLASVAAAGRSSSYFAGEVVRPDGERRYVQLSGRLLPETTAGPVVALSMVDATEQRARERALAEGSMLDALTGLPNRALLFDRITQAAGRGGGGAVALVDLDRFKILNDRFGHEVGDAILRTVSARLAESVPAEATVARVGGDEFVVLLPGAELVEATELVDRLLEAVSAPIPTALEPVVVTASVGLAPLDSAMADLVLRRADAAMYEAKKKGANQVVVYGPEVAVWAENLWDLAATVARLEHDRSRLEVESRTDALTGLPNVRALDEAMAAMATHHERRGDPFSVLFLDLDHFGAFNKRRGDAAGDKALRWVARTVASACREGDTAYRKGGEELVILLPATNHEAAVAVGERLRAAVEGLGIVHDGHPDTPVLTVTVGVATSRAGERVDQVAAQAADAAMSAKLSDRRNSTVSAGD